MPQCSLPMPESFKCLASKFESLLFHDGLCRGTIWGLPLPWLEAPGLESGKGRLAENGLAPSRESQSQTHPIHFMLVLNPNLKAPYDEPSAKGLQ